MVNGLEARETWPCCKMESAFEDQSLSTTGGSEEFGEITWLSQEGQSSLKNYKGGSIKNLTANEGGGVS